MKKLVRCKACNFVMEEGKLKDVCPACGASNKVFEPYDNPVSEKRQALLDRHLHPIIVHVPQGYAATLVVISLLIFAVPAWQSVLTGTFAVLLWGLPLSLIGAFLSGLLDAKIRFRKVTTRILHQKMAWGSLFFLLSVIMLGITLTSAWPSPGTQVAMLVLSVACLACSTALGILGTSLLNARFPGK